MEEIFNYWVFGFSFLNSRFFNLYFLPQSFSSSGTLEIPETIKATVQSREPQPT